ncbi:hypothetical protein MTP09_12010 [Chryseobacterium suipulveris]|uniref:HTH HARE-type domain-containing protein n=1 Tax=Chryseobacterium suipulveris TaxID=2929800 RepID=A0ABY4BN47_9FLAO|nr:hypothetical protein [Chryseobacterium suipulveris]UOE40617.1 hypothetical protein MTP09_12010 [Chryseobacterium suipulveris]
MTIKEAVLKSLEEIQKPIGSFELCDYILSKKYVEFKGKTPHNTVSAHLTDFIYKNDKRIKRVKKQGGNYLYYLSKFEEDIVDIQPIIVESQKTTKKESYKERDLHILLSTFLKDIENVFSKTIYHEKSLNKENGQVWTNPDMVGVNFLQFRNKISQEFFKKINQKEAFKISSYELKREISSDNELKQAYFQAVSNSSWANYGYLVALDFSDDLLDEIERLNQSFGVGIIKLSANPYQSKILYPARYRNLDFKTIDKLCKMNPEFERFIEHIEKLMGIEDRFYRPLEKDFESFCDRFFSNDNDILVYCKDKNIPFEENSFE